MTGTRSPAGAGFPPTTPGTTRSAPSWPGPRSDGGAPFIALTLFARGLNHHLFTRVYLPDGEALESDPYLSTLPSSRRSTLVAVRGIDQSLVFDIHLQGEQETVFLSFGPAPGPAAGPAAQP